MIDANNRPNPEDFATLAQLPEAREWVVNAIQDASAAGLAREAVTAALLVEAFSRLHAEHGALALAGLLGEFALRFSRNTDAPDAFN